jgi:LytR cell envelope-related transcriptional attenuator
VKTYDDLWRWIWEDDRVFDDEVLADLFDGSPTSPPPPSSAIRTEDVWEWLSREDPLLEADPLGEIPTAGPGRAASPSADPTALPLPAPAAAPPLPPAPPLPAPAPPPPAPAVDAEPPIVAEEPPPDTVRPVPVEAPRGPAPALQDQTEAPAMELRRRERAWGRPVRYLSLVLVAAAVGAVAPQVLPAVLRSADTIGSKVAAVPEQTVVAWSVVDDDRGLAFVALMAAGARPPVAVAVPAEVTINLPGQGLGTVREAAVSGKKGPLAVALENLIGVPVDASVTMTAQDLAVAVDAAGTIEVADQAMNGGAVLAYLTAPEAAEIPDERFLRWQDVLDGLLDAVEARGDVAGSFQEPLSSVLTASSPERADLLALPVVELGAGLTRPDEKGIGELVDDRFIPQPGDVIRLVVLNGVGEPGIGEDVARILIPNGFRLVSSENANRFDYKVTKIIASSEEDLPAAERARDLLGVGQILLGAQPQLSDVIVVVGRDFTGGR